MRINFWLVCLFTLTYNLKINGFNPYKAEETREEAKSLMREVCLGVLTASDEATRQTMMFGHYQGLYLSILRPMMLSNEELYARLLQLANNHPRSCYTTMQLLQDGIGIKLENISPRGDLPDLEKP